MTLKRIFAYLIDIFIVSILVNLILYLPFLKNTQERYLETSNEYFEEIFNSTSGSSDLTENRQEISRRTWKGDRKSVV